MRKLSTLVFVALSLILPALSFAQSSSPVWFTLNAPEGSVITASSSITLRFGQVASTCAAVMSSGPCSGVSVGAPSPEAWTSPKTFTPASGSASVSVVVNTATFGGVDPLPGVYKTVRIQEKTTAQTITANGQSVTVPGTSTPSSSQVWFTLSAPEGAAITAPAAITLRYGQLASTCSVVSVSSGPCQGASVGKPTPETWTSPQTFNPAGGASSVKVTVSTATFNNVDPLPGVYKTVQILEKTTTQPITVNGQSITVPGTSSPATCQLVATPAAITFQNTTVGYTLSSTGSITSNCPTTVTVSSVRLSGPYTVSGFQTPFSLASGQKQNYTAVFAPTATGTANGNITFTSNASTTPNLSVSLTGTGVGSTQVATLTTSATSLAFGNVAVNIAQSKTVTITNSGSSSITVSAVRVAGTGFSISPVTTPFILTANQTRQITVILTPTTSGSASGALTITSNASNPTLTIPLSGTGVSSTKRAVTLSWNPSSSPVSGYNIYRSTVSGGSYSKINSSTITTASYTDQTVVGGSTYYYTVTAVSANMQSGYSNEVKVVVPTP